jgi:hypothetical protein
MIEDELKSIASDLEQLRLDPAASLHYEIMSDALVWSDELLRNRRAREIWCMRPVLRYRTGLILGLDLVEFRETWKVAKNIFPKWIGFAQQRCERSASLEALYRQLSKK